MILLILFQLFSVDLGVDQLFTPQHFNTIKGKRIGLVTNQTGVNKQLVPTAKLIEAHPECTLVALFAPEHGIKGTYFASEAVPSDAKVYSLHGTTRRPTEEMLKGIDVLVYDIQDIGCRSYTFISTLFYVMEEAAKLNIPVVVCDRPNPINGIVVDGPMLEEKWRSFVGYINVPYCHGMTVAELAQFFNQEYKVGCKLTIIPMQGWKRQMTFRDTGLTWVPTSPNIPEPTSPYYYPMTGIMGEMSIANIGVANPLPFRVVGAPWIDGEKLTQYLRKQKIPGVKFIPFSYKPYNGLFAGKECDGIYITVVNPLKFQPVSTQYAILGALKSLYPKEFEVAIKKNQKRLNMFNKVNGTEEIAHILNTHPYPGWVLRSVDQKQRNAFLKKRTKYLQY